MMTNCKMIREYDITQFIKRQERFPMSIHSSLKCNEKIAVKRNVLKRFERIDILKKVGKFKNGQRVWGLAKTKST